VATVLAVALGPAPAWAGRPLDTEDTGTLEPGNAELELSGDFARNPEDRTWFAGGQAMADEAASRAGAPSPRRWQLEEEVAIARGQALLVEFTEDTGLIRRD
jgi:hypothetical protein